MLSKKWLDKRVEEAAAFRAQKELAFVEIVERIQDMDRDRLMMFARHVVMTLYGERGETGAWFINPDKEWTPETLTEIVGDLGNAGLIPQGVEE